MIYFCVVVMYSGEYDVCDVTLSVIHTGVKRNSWPLRNIWPSVTGQKFRSWRREIHAWCMLNSLSAKTVF
jgi:hypothetical protein